MVDGHEAKLEDLADILYVLEAERRLGELSIGYLGIDHGIHHLVYLFFGIFFQAPAACLDGIGHHEDSSLAGSRLGTGVLEVESAHLFARVGIDIGVVEIAHERGAVVGGDEMDDHLWQVMLACECLALGDMGDDDTYGLLGFAFQEGVVAGMLVLDEATGVGELTYIMV